MMRLILLLCAGRATASKSFSYKRDTVAASALRELADKLPPVDFERSCYERAAVSDAVAAVFGVPSGTKVPMNTRRGPLEEHQDRPHRWAESGEGVMGRVQILYLEASGPPSYFVLVDADTKAEYHAITQPDGVADYVLAADAETDAEAGDSTVRTSSPARARPVDAWRSPPLFDLSPRN